jgi:hypothetical protein
MFYILNKPVHHGRHHEGRHGMREHQGRGGPDGWEHGFGEGHGHRGGRKLHRFDHFEEADDMDSQDGFELFRKEQQRREHDKASLKLCLVTILISLLTLISGSLGKWATWGDKTHMRLRRILKKSAIFMGIAIFLMLFWQLPSAFRVIDSMDFKNKDHGARGQREQFQNQPAPQMQASETNWIGGNTQEDPFEDINQIIEQAFQDMPGFNDEDIHQQFMQFQQSFQQSFPSSSQQTIVVQMGPSRGRGRNLRAKDDCREAFASFKNAVQKKVNKVKKNLGEHFVKPMEEALDKIKATVEDKLSKMEQVANEIQEEQEQKIHYSRDDVEQAFESFEYLDIFNEEDQERMTQLIGDLTNWMNEYADEVGSAEDQFLESFVVAFQTVDQMEEDKIEKVVTVESGKHKLQAAPFDTNWEQVYDIEKPRDWDYLDIEDWDKIMNIQDPISEDEEEYDINRIDRRKYKNDFVQFILTLTKE